MRVHVVYAHPNEESFHAAIHAKVLERLNEAGHEVDDLDLYAEDFDPRLTRDERRGYHDLETNQQTVSAYVDRLKAAEALVLCYPVWNFGYPAILKGWFDRVWLPGVTFKMKNGKVAPSLHNIHRVVAVTTYGGSKLRAWLVNDPPRKCVTRVIRAIVKPGATIDYVAHYDMNRSTAENRAVFLETVGRRMGAF
ncbi:MAG: NAD(P)H-dependent oxidoreductase [Pseudomonadota bacterium]